MLTSKLLYSTYIQRVLRVAEFKWTSGYEGANTLGRITYFFRYQSPHGILFLGHAVEFGRASLYFGCPLVSGECSFILLATDLEPKFPKASPCVVNLPSVVSARRT